MVSQVIEAEATDLDRAARPAVDALTVKVTSTNLERVRRIKSRLSRLTTRVERVRVEIQRLLDDDSDMRDMCVLPLSSRVVGGVRWDSTPPG